MDSARKKGAIAKKRTCNLEVAHDSLICLKILESEEEEIENLGLGREKHVNVKTWNNASHVLEPKNDALSLCIIELIHSFGIAMSGGVNL